MRFGLVRQDGVAFELSPSLASPSSHYYKNTIFFLLMLEHSFSFRLGKGFKVNSTSSQAEVFLLTFETKSINAVAKYDHYDYVLVCVCVQDD